MSHIFKRILFLASLFLWITCAPPGDQGQVPVSTPTKSGGATTTAPLPPATPSLGGGSLPAPQTGVLKRDRVGGFTIQGDTKEEFFGADISVSNLDGDQYADVIVASRDGKVFIFYGKKLAQISSGQTILASTADKIIQAVVPQMIPMIKTLAGKFSNSTTDDVILSIPGDNEGMGVLYIFTSQKLLGYGVQSIPLSAASYKMSGYISSSDRATASDVDGFFGMSAILADVDGDG
ncbi:MAG: hypothetical protein HYY62_05995, partial [Deltaproteobacteria bacterium]|nr:hypothetical protein [Deltaproteobacteria bacterium]